MKKLAIAFGVFLALSTSCKKPITQPNGGIYRGVFIETGLNGGLEFNGDCTLALNEAQNTYVLAVDSTSSVPYPCSGTYRIIDDSKIQFFTNANTQDSTIDANLFLDSIYIYSFNNTNFDLSKTVDTIKYEYKLVRY
jgi:hypothetical protein